jgi:hypothetical protein
MSDQPSEEAARKPTGLAWATRGSSTISFVPFGTRGINSDSDPGPEAFEAGPFSNRSHASPLNFMLTRERDFSQTDSPRNPKNKEQRGQAPPPPKLGSGWMPHPEKNKKLKFLC